MHTSYQPLKPATNKLLKKRWDGAAQDMHRKRVSAAKPVVDTKSPATYTHLQYKMKKMQVNSTCWFDSLSRQGSGQEMFKVVRMALK